MRGVCKAWRTGLDSLATYLSIQGDSEYVDWPLPLDLGQRFSCLTSVDLTSYTLNHIEWLEPLLGLKGKVVSNVSLKLLEQAVPKLLEGT